MNVLVEPKYKGKVYEIPKEIVYHGEIFEDITKEEISFVYPYYQISNCGRVYHKYLGKIMSPGINGGGYKFVELSTFEGPKPIQIHRLMMMKINSIPNPDLYDVNHKNGNKLDDYDWNLEWCTRKENILHSYNTGLHVVGEDNVLSTISNQQAINICELLQTGDYTNKEIASMTGATESIVSSIKQKESWIHISKDYDFYQRPGKLFSDNDILLLCRYFAEVPKPDKLSINKYCKMALNDCGLCSDEQYIDSVRKLYTRKYYTNISKNFDY